MFSQTFCLYFKSISYDPKIYNTKIGITRFSPRFNMYIHSQQKFAFFLQINLLLVFRF